MALVRSGPIFVWEAREAGLSWEALQTQRWARMSRGQYAPSRNVRDLNLLLEAVARRMPASYAFSGQTAAWLLGLDATLPRPVEVTVDREVPIRARAGFRVRRAALSDSEVVLLRGFRTTSALRTVRDLGSSRDQVESIIAIEIAVRAGVVDMSELAQFVAAHPGEKGIKRLRRALSLADPRSESPMETRLRMLLIKARLPEPCVQTDLHDPSGDYLGRADLYYPDRRLVLEFDGDNHRDRLVSDVRRQNALINAGFHVLRFTAADLRVPAAIASQVRNARARLPNHG